MNAQQAVEQLERSERGQITCKLLRDFFESPAVKGLDADNSEAVATLTIDFMLGSSAEACAVIAGLDGVIERNPWVLK